MKIKLLSVCLLLCAGSYTCMAQNRTMEFGFQSDNDSFLAQGSDRYYTNGLFLFFRKGMNFKNPKLGNKVLGIEIGQKIFNPQSGYVPDSTYIDRPFAGYSYIGASMNYLYRNESSLKFGVQVGVIGPSAKGKEIQEVIHNTFGFYELNGWQYQIRNSFQVNLSAGYNRLLVRPNEWFDLSATAYGNAGTGFNGAGIGPMVRLGKFYQLFNSTSTQSMATSNSIAPLHKKEFFAYYKPQFNYIGYDATVQGSITQKQDRPGEITSQPEHIVLSHQVGVSYASSRLILGFEAMFRSKEVKTQVQKNHQWGSVTVMYRFSSHKPRI